MFYTLTFKTWLHWGYCLAWVLWSKCLQTKAEQRCHHTYDTY